MSKPRQEEIPGTASQERNPELHALAIVLDELRDEVKEQKQRLKDKEAEVEAKMKALGLEEYDVDGVALWLEKGASKVKVRVKEGAGDGDDE